MWYWKTGSIRGKSGQFLMNGESVMLRFIGGVLVVTATTAAGILYGMELQEYLEKLLYIRHIIYMLKGEMEYSRAPLSEVFARVAVRVKEPYRRWLLAMEKQVEGRTEDAFLKIWMRATDRYLGELHLKSGHSIQAQGVGDISGTDGLRVRKQKPEIVSGSSGTGDRESTGRHVGKETYRELPGSDGRYFSGSIINLKRSKP